MRTLEKYLFIYLFNFILVVVAVLKKEKKFRFSIPKIPKLRGLRG
jgi:hypothetical protein